MFWKKITKFGCDSHISLSAKRTNLCYVEPEWLEVQLSKLLCVCGIVSKEVNIILHYLYVLVFVIEFSLLSEIQNKTPVLLVTLSSLLKLVWTWTLSLNHKYPTMPLTKNFTGASTTFYNTVSRFTIIYWKKAQWNHDLKLNPKSLIS